MNTVTFRELTRFETDLALSRLSLMAIKTVRREGPYSLTKEEIEDTGNLLHTIIAEINWRKPEPEEVTEEMVPDERLRKLLQALVDMTETKKPDKKYFCNADIKELKMVKTWCDRILKQYHLDPKEALEFHKALLTIR